MLFILTLVLGLFVSSISSFSPITSRHSLRQFSRPSSLAMSSNLDTLIEFFGTTSKDIIRNTMTLADTSISEEEVLDSVGRVSDLPDPLYALGFAAVVFIGVAILQFSLGDLTKEEGQARVRDFLQTKKETERTRGYFDED